MKFCHLQHLNQKMRRYATLWRFFGILSYMNFKQLFPSFRNRYRFVRSALQNLSQQQALGRALNLGTGEGDYDRMIAAHTLELIGCDVNEADLDHARALNAAVKNLHYEVNNALDLSYPDDYFDLIVSSEVLEHVGKPDQMIREMYRVLAPGGHAIMTFPSREFPFTYDPVNRIWQWIKGRDSREYLISQGAYAFGHEYLIGSDDFKKWAAEAGFEVLAFRPLSGLLVGLLEIYWTGIAQSIFKKNARNVTADVTGTFKVRPADTKEPSLVFLTDALLFTDRVLSAWSKRSVGKGVILRKPA
jgi:ubiquinone/menaquinone biosynthesis C-methylase UbiE